MEVNKEELRRLAEAAKIKSSGDWKVFTPDDYQGPDQLPGLGVEDCEGKAIVWYAELPDSGIQYDEHASFIAAANPAAILSLLDENAQIRAENERIRRELTAFRNNTSISGSQIEWIDQILSKEGSDNP